MLFCAGFPGASGSYLELILPFTWGKRLSSSFLWAAFCSFSLEKPFFLFRPYYLYSIVFHHITTPAFSLLLLPCASQRWGVVVCRTGLGEGYVALSGELRGGSCQVKEYGTGIGTANWVSKPGNYSEHCHALSIARLSPASVSLPLTNRPEVNLGSGLQSPWKWIPHLLWHLSHPTS